VDQPLFSSHLQEFADITNDDNLESQPQRTTGDDTEDDVVMSVETHLAPQDMATVANIHNIIYTHLVKGNWLTGKPVDQKTLSVVEPVTLGHQVAQTLVQNMLKYLGKSEMYFIHVCP
jgi:hypothetical protein